MLYTEKKKFFSVRVVRKSSTEACFHCGIKNKISAFFLTILSFFSHNSMFVSLFRLFFLEL